MAITIPIRDIKPHGTGFCARLSTPRTTMPRLDTNELPLMLQALASKYSNLSGGDRGFAYSFQATF